MPNTKSAIKRVRSDKQKHLRNQAVLSELHTRYKKLVALANANAETAKEYALTLISKLDKAAVHGVIPHGRADRRKSRIAKLLTRK